VNLSSTSSQPDSMSSVQGFVTTPTGSTGPSTVITVQPKRSSPDSEALARLSPPLGHSTFISMPRNPFIQGLSPLLPPPGTGSSPALPPPGLSILLILNLAAMAFLGLPLLFSDFQVWMWQTALRLSFAWLLSGMNFGDPHAG
jgi:hypothetical protein